MSLEEGVCCEDSKESQSHYLRVEGLTEPGPLTVLIEELSLARPPESLIKPTRQAVKGARVCRLSPLGLPHFLVLPLGYIQLPMSKAHTADCTVGVHHTGARDS